MVEVVGPVELEPPAALVDRTDRPRVVEAALGDQQGARVDGPHPVGQLGQQVAGARVDDRVEGVDPQPVDVEVAHPALGALQHPLAHRAGGGVVEVRRASPRRRVLVGEVRAERVVGRRARRADVVVDDVEQHAHAGRVGGIDQAGEPVGSAVGRLRGARVHAVVAPAPPAGELADRHELDRGDAELGQAREVGDHRGERALRRERADVELVEHLRGRVERRDVHRAARGAPDRPPETVRGCPRAASASTGRATRCRRARTGSRRRDRRAASPRRPRGRPTTSG